MAKNQMELDALREVLINMGLTDAYICDNDDSGEGEDIYVKVRFNWKFINEKDINFDGKREFFGNNSTEIITQVKEWFYYIELNGKFKIVN
jgi:hypothetical protein